MGKKIRHRDFGVLVLELADQWKGQIEFPMYGKTFTISHLIDIDEETGVESFQLEEFSRFQKRKKTLSKEMERELFRHYQSVCKQVREHLDIQDPNHPQIPILKRASDLSKLIELEALYNPYTQPGFGMLFQATWAPELGVGVEIHHGKVIRIGPQDIIL